ncbi:hypothetical protein GCM10020366_41670 [Saccharopolyspora gregorii]|uniref:Uncharacterized protein n=1 Tax=Saccharopolyspora gregorii TaxID=33914 RepID=A0ABP6RUQ8_9PSEU
MASVTLRGSRCCTSLFVGPETAGDLRVYLVPVLLRADLTLGWRTRKLLQVSAERAEKIGPGATAGPRTKLPTGVGRVGGTEVENSKSRPELGWADAGNRGNAKATPP